MKKILVILFCCVLAVSLGACGAKPQTAQDQGQAYNGSIEDLINAGKSVKCVLQAKASEDILGGTTYVSGKNARSDFEQKDANNVTTSGHFISDGTWMYTWSDTYKDQAVKLKVSEMQNANLNSQANQQGAGNYEDKMDYKCYAWSADPSYFTPPADVNFQDMTELLKQFGGAGDNGGIIAPNVNSVDNSALCGQCNQVADEAAKAMCKKQLGCK